VKAGRGKCEDETEEESETSSAGQKPQGVAELYSSPWHAIGWMDTIKGPELVANGVATGRYAGGTHCLSVIVPARRRDPADVHLTRCLFLLARYRTPTSVHLG
jgi:hypothetical protein